jgi:acylphosphatase
MLNISCLINFDQFAFLSTSIYNINMDKNNVSYHFTSDKILKETVISVGFDVSTSTSSINALNKTSVFYEDVKFEDLDAAAVCLSIYVLISKSLSKSTVDEVKGKVNILGYGYNNGQFFINATCPSQRSPVKKFIKTALKAINPSFTTYSLIMKNAEFKADKEAFKYQWNAIVSNIKKNGVHVMIAGSPKLKEKLKEIVDASAPALSVSLTEAGTKRSGATDMKKSKEFLSIKVSGVALSIFKKFVEDVTGHIVHVQDDEVLLPSSTPSSILNKIKNESKFRDFITSKYGKYSSSLPAIAAFNAIMHLYDSPKKIAAYKDVNMAVITQFLK